MTFSRIKLHGWAVNEKLTSTQMNQLDIDHSNAVDKTGDNVSNGGGISGEIDILSTGSLDALSGSSVTIASGSNLNIDGYATVASGGNLIVASGGEEVLRSGSNLIAQSGSQTTFNNGAHATFNSGSSTSMAGVLNVPGGVYVTSTGAVEFESSSSLLLDSGSTTTANGLVSVSSGSVVFGSGSTLTIESGTTGTLEGTGTLSMAGAALTISDSNNPTFVSARTRYIVQPLIVQNNVYSNQPQINAGNFVDNGSTGSAVTYILPWTKMINGATLSGASIFVQNNSGSNITSANASYSLWQCAANSNSPSQIGSTQTLGSLSAGSSTYLTIGSISPTINDALYTYYGLITTSHGSGGGALTWSAQTCTITNITTLGQF